MFAESRYMYSKRKVGEDLPKIFAALHEAGSAGTTCNHGPSGSGKIAVIRSGAHARTHARTRAHTHARRAHAHTRTNAHAHTRMHAHAHAHTHTHTRTHARTHAHTHSHTHKRTHMHTHTHMHKRTRTRTHAHAHAHTHTTHPPTPQPKSNLNVTSGRLSSLPKVRLGRSGTRRSTKSKFFHRHLAYMYVKTYRYITTKST